MFNVYSVRTGGRGDVGARYLSFADFCSKRWGQNYSRSFAPSLSPSLEQKYNFALTKFQLRPVTTESIRILPVIFFSVVRMP